MKSGTTYKDSGVDIGKGDEFIESIKPGLRSTFRREVIGDVGGFGSFFSLHRDQFKEPVLVSSTDGVGTKLKIAFMMNKHDTIGIDLVAMCVNDIVVQGAEPLFFLDYLSTGKLEPKMAKDTIEGIVKGCREANCSLLGGETAEMPGFYQEGEYDLAGFTVGIVEREKIIDGSAIVPGDKVIGIASSGLHSNGFSLARKVLLEDLHLPLHENIPEIKKTLGEELLIPTKIYIKTILNLIKNFSIHGIAHITGGGIAGNTARILPQKYQAIIKTGCWEIPSIFTYIQKKGEVTKQEMFRTFNNGLGMIIVIPDDNDGVKNILNQLKEMGEVGYLIGEIKPREKGKDPVTMLS